MRRKKEMGLVGSNATFVRKARRSLHHFLALVLAVSTLSAISIVKAPVALGATVTSSIGTNPSRCNQEVGSNANISAFVRTIGSIEYCLIEFRNTTQTTWTKPAGVTSIDVLVVGGGGGGGSNAGAGGAGGGSLFGALNVTTSSFNFNVVAGAGGAGGAGGTNSAGSAGGTSSVSSSSPSIIASASGGAGGATYVSTSSVGGNAFTTTGMSASNTYQGGAGGRGSITNGGAPFTGADGIKNSITGSTYAFGAGGGGGGWGAAGAAGGSYSGGAGGSISGAGANAGDLGSGGGGGDAGQRAGGNGAVGIVILRYSLVNNCVSPTSSGGFTTFTISNVGSCTWTVPSGVTSLQVLLVAGGGGGGAWVAGGGGGGGFIENASLTSITAGSSYQLFVGPGGEGTVRNFDTTHKGSNGGNTLGFNLTAVGGGVGATWNSYTTGNGGSGGGGSQDTTEYDGGSGTAEQGNPGGAGYSPTSNAYLYGYPTGGGGGAGAVGASASGAQSGAGGAGKVSAITGSTYAGGGGGGCHGGSTTATCLNGAGGLGGGGAGNGSNGTASGVVGTSGTSSTGGGGGGAGNPGGYYSKGGDGGSGLIVVRYVNPPSISLSTSTVSATVGTAITNLTVTNSGGAATYTVSPSLPSGLSINSSTGVVSGTPSAITSSATYTITATNSTGTATATFSIAVAAGAALTPTFGSATATADGFTVQISNYSASYTWAGTATASGTVAINGTGLVTVTGVAPGTSSTATITTTRAEYTGGSATVSATAIQGTQTITRTSTSPSSPLVSGTYTPTATASSGLSVVISIASGSSSICSIASGVVTFNAAGSCVIQYNQAGNTGTSAAPQVTETLTVSKASQSITFGSLSNRTLGSGTYSISASSTSSLSVAFTSATTSVCTVATTTITLVTAGTCTINANQAGNTNYLAATQVQQSFTIAPALLITTPSGASLQGTYNTTFTSLTIVSSGGAGTNSFSATGSLPTGVSLSSAGVLSGTPSIAGSFSLTVTVTDANGATATTSSFTISIAKGVSTLSISVPAYTFTGSPQGPDSVTTSGSAGAVTFAYAGRGSTTYASSSTKPTNVGTYTVTATLATDTNFASVSAAADFQISNASLVITPTISASLMAYGTSGGSLPTISHTKSPDVSLTTNPTCALYLASDNGFVTAQTLSATLAAGSYVVRCAGAAVTNYTISYGTNPSFTVTKIDITLTVGTPASTTYTGSAASVTNSFTRTTGTLAGSDAISGMTYTYTSAGGYNSTTAPTDGGTYTITGSSATFSSGSASNYTITYVAGSLTISTATQTVTWAPTTSLLTTNSPATPSTLATALGSATISYAVTSAGATGCTVDSATGVLTFSTAGSCQVTATAAATSNYATASTAVTFVITVPTFVITLAAGTNGSGSNQTLTKTYGVSLTLPDSTAANGYFTRTGYTVSGWITSNGGSETHALGGSFTTDAATTFYPVWTANGLTVTYDSKSGSAVSNGTVNAGASISAAPTAPTRAGYTFAGWSATDGGTAVTFPYTHGQTSNFTLFAKWSANSLTVTYDSKSGSAVSNGTVNTAASISLAPTAPTRAGYAFGGWSATDTGTAVTFPHAHGQTADFTLYAVWSANSLTVSYDSQSGSAVTSGAVNTGASISAAPTAPTRTGYTFAGWSTTTTGSVVTFPYAHGQTTNFTLYAIWSANALTIIYDSKSGSAVSNGTVNTAASISSAPTAPTRAGYTFAGWTVTDGGTAVTFPFAHGQTADFTLFAKWSANALTITYNSQGGSAVSSGSVNTAASISSAPTSPTRAGYTFAGWSATDTGTAVTFPHAHGQTADFTLFAKWSANALTITYNSQGGSAVSSGSVNTAASISAAPTAPTRAGYAFAGWSATDTGTAVTFPHAHGQTADFTLFAKWSANALTITYDSKSGSAVSSGTVNTGASISVAPTAPTRTGYTFGGWSATDTGTAVTFPHAHGQTADFTLFAKWTGNTNTITYDSKGGATVADGSFVTGGSIAAAPTEPIRAGYTLVGWSLTDGGSIISYPYSPPGTSGITLYAIWTGIACSPTSTTTGGYTIYTFATAGTCFWSVPAGITDVEILAVAGGGGGGYAWDNAGAGGGAGGQVKTGAATLGSILEVTVGVGGTAGTVSSTRGGSGGNSSASTIVALGGTGGCAARAITCSDSAQATSLAAANGGVGGVGGTSGRGGGGSNTAGTLTTTTAGGAGTASNYSGTSVTYGVGGTGGTARGLATNTNIVGAAGSANTGNGGGGASAKISSGEVNGGVGGAGLLVVRIASALTITFDSQSGSAVSNGSTFTGASIATAPTEPTRSNYTFLGWFTATTGGSAITFPYVHGQTANFTLYAQWTLNTYSIVFNANSGLGLMGNQIVTHGVATNLNANLYSRANYVFYRWATAADGTGTTYNNLAEITLTAGTTLYAQWTPNTYVVTFNYNGGNGGDSTATASFTTAGSPITLPVPTKTGFTFAGWHSDAALATQIGTGVGNRSYSPTGGALSLNAYAKWEAVNYTFTYNSNSADSGTVPTESSKQITQTATVKANTGNLVRVGYTFSGWNIASDGTGTNYLSGSLFTVGSDDVILFAKWSPNTYTVTYNTNGGTGNAQRSSANVTSDTYTTDSSPVVFPGVGTLTRSGYTFGGWNTSAAGTGTNYVATNTYTTVSNVIFYAKWNPVTYTITYNGNQNTGGTTPTAGGYTTGQDSPYAVLSNSFTKTLNVFGGWNTADNGTGTSYSPGASITTLVNIVLYAVWIPQFTLHYAINGGSVTSGSLPGDQLYNTGTSVGPLFSAVSRTGYTFDGWVNGSTTIVPNGNFTILADSVLTAKWTPINYTISYNSDGGSEAPESTTRQIGQSFTVDAAVSKPGYNFAGWATGSTVVGPDAVVVMGSANIAYTARWVARVYTISYDWNGGRGTAVEDVNYTFGTTAITLPLVGDRVKDGFTFAGWSETSTGSLLSATYIPSQTRTLIARWTVGNFTITYNLSGGTLANASVAVQNGSSTILPLPTRTNFVFDGWHTATIGGSPVGANGDSITPTASQTVYARWIQSSLFGISNSLTRIGSVVTVANIANTFSGANSNSSVLASVPENALPAGTTINFDLVGNSSRATGLLPNVNYLISIAISWITADGLVPDTVPGKPISVTISNETIKIGATAYAIVNNASTLLGTATQDRTITIALTSDPEVVIAAVKPSAPLNVTATSNGHQQSVISWSAPSTNGGSDINGYTVTSNTSATCTTTTTSCTISSLAHGTAYTFTVTATNNVGTSDASTSASATTAALYTVTFNAKGGTPVANGSFLTASTVSEPTAPTRAGYSFAGWSATDGGSAIGFPYAPGVTSNITLFARWDALDNAVTFNSKGGSTVSSSVFSSGGTVTEPTAPTKSGFTFAGWAATDTGTAVTFPHAPGVVTDITLYAKWTEIVQNNSGGSSAPAPVTPSVPAPVVPVKSNVTVVAPVTVTGDKDAKVNAVEVEVLPSGSTAKPPTIKIDKTSEKFIAEVKVVGGKLVLTPETGFSGKRTVTVTITENSVERIVQIPITVLPEVVTKPTVAPVNARRSTIRWAESPNATSYTVYLEGKKVCITTGTSCNVNKILGPRASVEIVSNGGDKTLSEKVEADFKPADSIILGKIVSPTFTKVALTDVDVSKLDRIASIIKAQGFKNIFISEITTTKKTAAMAEARIALIKKYLRDKVGSNSLKFEIRSPASRTSLNIISVKA